MKKIIRGIICAILFSALSISYVLAADNSKIMSAYCNENEVIIFVKNAEAVSDNYSYQIGSKVCDEVTAKSLRDSGINTRTLIMVDNSLSIPKNDRDRIKEVIKGIINGHGDNEFIRLATFSEKIEYLSEYSNDYRALMGVCDSITHNDQETYLTDVLYDLIDELNKEAFQGYTRIIVISDGVDNKPIGVTKEELNSLLKDNSYPIYSLGTKTGKNDSELENMFALSRITNGEYFILDDANNEDILSEISRDRELVVVMADLPDDLKSGSRSNSRLSLPDGSTLDFEIRLPFGSDKIDDSTKGTFEPVEEEMKSDEENVEEIEEEDTEEKDNNIVSFFKERRILLILIAIIILIIALVVLVIVNQVMKKRQRQEAANPDLSGFAGRPSFENATTEMIVENNNGDRTNLMFDAEPKGSKPIYRLTLSDKNDTSKVFECELRDAVIIGRKSEVTDLAINYDKSVSGKHCMITCKNGRFFIQDLGSSNHTKLNGEVVFGEEEVRNGDIISLGRVDLYFSAI